MKEGFSIKLPDAKAKILGIALIVIGLILFFIPSFLNMKLGLATVFLGIFTSIIITKEKSSTDLLTSMKITLAIAIWIITVLLLTFHLNLEMFFVLMGAGILAIKVFSNEHISDSFRIRFNIIILGLILIYSAIIAQKIMNILIT